MISVPVSIGELIDKLSILRVKQQKITNEEKLNYVNKEFELLFNLSWEYLKEENISTIYDELIDTNLSLWEIEDRLRILEKEQKFDEEFIQLARRVYFTNDDRFKLKNQINTLLSSEIREIKEYVKYS